jgi:hypothetical protein
LQFSFLTPSRQAAKIQGFFLCALALRISLFISVYLRPKNLQGNANAPLEFSRGAFALLLYGT